MIDRLRLGHKFTIGLAVVFVAGTIISGLILAQILQRRAEDEVVAKSRILTGFEDAVRDYTNQELTPILLPISGAQQDFMMETVPTFATKQVFALLNRDPAYRDFQYKPATLNPTNPTDLADSEEAALVVQFRERPDASELSGYRTLGDQTVFYSARPIRVTSESCLGCHSTPDAAPVSMVAEFGDNRGFGWQLGSVIGAQVVYVPASDVFAAAHRSIGLVLGVFVAIFAVVIFLINVLLGRLVIGPAHRMSNLAQQITQGELDDDEAPASIRTLDSVAARGDELGASARALQQMAREVHAREQALKEQVRELRIEIDHAKKEHEVNEIVESEFFRDLQSKAERLRRAPEGD